MSYFKRHIFFCTNQRKPGESCCADFDAERLRAYAKNRIKEKIVSGAGAVRVNSAGCLDRCELGPVAVVYPEGVWYAYVDESDIDEIVDRHLLKGEIVERLKLD